MKYRQEEWWNLTGQERLAEIRRILAKYGYEWKRVELHDAPTGMDDQDTDSYRMLVGPDGKEVEAVGGTYDALLAYLFQREEDEASVEYLVTLAEDVDNSASMSISWPGNSKKSSIPATSPSGILPVSTPKRSSSLKGGLEALKQDGLLVEYRQADSQWQRHARYLAAEQAKNAANERLCNAKESGEPVELGHARQRMDQAWALIRLIESEA